MQALPNTGIFNDDRLDRLRADAIGSSVEGLPAPVVDYLRVLESRLLDVMVQEKKRSLREIGWKHRPGEEEKP